MAKHVYTGGEHGVNLDEVKVVAMVNQYHPSTGEIQSKGFDT